MNASVGGGGLLGRMSIGQRLAAGSMMFVLFVVVVSAVADWRLARLDDVTTRMAKVNLRVERVVGQWFADTKSNAVAPAVRPARGGGEWEEF